VEFAEAEGNTNLSKPFTKKSGYRYLQLIGGVAAGTYTHVDFRRNGKDVSQRRARSYQIDMRLSKAATRVAAPSSILTANHGSGLATVRTRSKTLFLPATQQQSLMPLPAPWEYTIPFDRPYVFAGGTLAMEIELITVGGTGEITLDAASGQDANPRPLVFSVGKGCKVAGKSQRAHLTSSVTPRWSKGYADWNWNCTNLRNNDIGVLFFGFSNRNWGPLPLPIELPGSATAASGSCVIQTGIEVAAAYPTTSVGTLKAQMRLPLEPWMNGLELFAQVLALDPAANGFGMVFSSMQRRHFIAPRGLVDTSYVETGSSGGLVRKHQGLVLRLR
jgi:hypothetical protein